MDFEAENQELIGIFTIDSRFVVQIWDAALERMTGITAGEARGKPVAEMIPDLEGRGILARFERALQEGTIEILSTGFHRFLISCPPRFPSKHFAEMRQRVTIAPLRENESIRGLIVTIEDVTARMEREQEQAGRLKAADAAVRLEAARAISEKSETLAAENAAPIIDALGDKNWRVRRRLVETLSRRAAPDAIAALLRAMQDRHFDFAVLNSALQVLQATSVKTTETLCEFLRGADADLRMQAALTLGEQRDPQAVPALLEALDDENANVRYHVIEALGKLKAREAVEPLLAIAETRDFYLSFASLEALRQIADESAEKRILPFLNDDFLRQAAVETLGAVGGGETVSPLVNLLNRDEFSAAAVAGALTAIFDRYENDFSKTRAAASAVVGRARAIIDTNGRSNLLAALDDADQGALIAVVRLAGWFDDEKIRERLAALLENENAREAAAESLARQGGEAVVDLLIEKLGADDAETRRTAARALGELKNERATLPLIEVLETDSETGGAAAAAAAARALGQIGDERAFEPLVELLKTGDAALCQAAVGALQSLAAASPETLSRVSGLLTADASAASGGDARLRESALRVAGHFGGAGCEDEIFNCCEDPDERVRRAAVEQLSFVRDVRSVPALIRVLKHDPVSRVREAAAKALSQVKGGGDDESAAAAAAAALREALTDGDAWTRYFAVRALGAVRDEASREILVEMAEDDAAEQVRAAAREVISEW